VATSIACAGFHRATARCAAASMLAANERTFRVQRPAG
jgi:hypothetical protein